MANNLFRPQMLDINCFNEGFLVFYITVFAILTLKVIVKVKTSKVKKDKITATMFKSVYIKLGQAHFEEIEEI